ncbi:hypothetical protein GGG16DRAFT_129702 [Schizophyllum commune]
MKPQGNSRFETLDRCLSLELLARQLTGELAFSPGGTAKSVLAELKAKVPTTFRALSDAPPSSLSVIGDDLVQVIFLSLRVSTHVWRARATRCLWPHIVRWAAFLHPARNHRDAARETFDIAQAYLVVVLEEMMSPVNTKKAFELWRYLPRIHAFYTNTSSAYVHRAFYWTIWLATTLFKILASNINAATSRDRALLCECVNIAMPRRQTLYRLIAPLTHCVAQLDMDPSTALNMWRSHLGLLFGIVELPELAPSTIPRSAFRPVILAGKRCLRLHDTRHGGYWAIRLVDILCRSTTDNRPFLHALEEDYLGLLIDFERYTGTRYDHTDLARIMRRPLNRVVNICPCGGVVHCSGSCQRMHWELVHQTQCCRDNGPWGLHGTFSLTDVTFLFDLVVEKTLLLQKNPEVREKLAAFDKKRRAGGCKSMQQVCLVTDYTDVLASRTEVEVQPARSRADAQRVFVEVAFRSGKATLRRRLPVTYPFEHFL